MNLSEVIGKARAVACRQHLALSTEKSYLHWIRMYAAWLQSTRPTESEARLKVEAFLSAEARRGVSAGTQNQAFCALLFLYRSVLGVELGNVDALRAKQQIHERHAPTREEVAALLGSLRDLSGYPTRLIVHLIYGCGLRVNEPLSLRIKDVDLPASRLTIRDPKHGHDRVVSLPCSVVPWVKRQMEVALETHAADVRDRIPVVLPGLLAKKYPRAVYDRGWTWLFPQLRPCRHPRTGETVRWHCLDQTVQRAVRAAAKTAGLSCIITPHHLRHAYATHALRSGASPRDIQAVLGHRSLETTMGYLHAEASRVISPLESLDVSSVPAGAKVS